MNYRLDVVIQFNVILAFHAPNPENTSEKSFIISDLVSGDWARVSTLLTRFNFWQAGSPKIGGDSTAMTKYGRVFSIP